MSPYLTEFYSGPQNPVAHRRVSLFKMEQHNPLPPAVMNDAVRLRGRTARAALRNGGGLFSSRDPCKCGEIDEHDDGTTDKRAAFSIIKDLARLQGLEPISSLDYEARYVRQKVQS
jgi:hypothetical protein